MSETGLDGRHRDDDGRIDQKRSDTLIASLRGTYGADFAPGWDGRRTLGELLSSTGAASLSQYLRERSARR